MASLPYTELNDRAVDSQHYKLAVMGRVVPFFADYYLYGEGKGHLRDKEEVYFLGNFGGERFIASLVIRKLGCGSKYEWIGIVAQPLSSKVRSESPLERVQILPTPAHSQGSYWFEARFTKIG